jgi:AraC-like DNA-binding protein
MTQTKSHTIPSVSCYPAYHELDANWGLFVTTAGFQLVLPEGHYPPEGFPETYSFDYQKGRVLNEFQLVYLTKGSGEFASSTIKTEVKEGDLFMLFPNEWHTYRPSTSTGWEVYWVGFRGANVEKLMTHAFFSKTSPTIRAGYREDLVGLFQQIIREAQQETPGFQQFISGCVSHMLGLAYQKKRADTFADKIIARKINKARMIIREQAETISPELLASELNVSYSWFRRSFKDYTGSSPTQYILLIKSQKAKELLANTDLTINEISEKLHYTSPYYFSVSFKRTSGMTPGEFRKMARGSGL